MFDRPQSLLIDNPFLYYFILLHIFYSTRELTEFCCEVDLSVPFVFTSKWHKKDTCKNCITILLYLQEYASFKVPYLNLLAEI